MRILARLMAVVLLAGAVMLATNAVAGAHSARISADPPDNATVTTSPAQVSATFNEPLQTTFAAMTVVGPDGNLWSAGDPRVQGAVVSIGVRPLGPVGIYTVHYRVTSADGHPVSGSWSFRLTVPGTGTPGPPVSTDDSASHDVGVWPFAVGAIVLVAGGALWAMRRRC